MFSVTDEAKKKHIASAASYDEFRYFVACADQKRVSRADMESLSKPEKGWQQKTNLAIGRQRKNGVKSTFKSRLKGSKDASLIPAFPSQPPKTPMEFERDWRRHCNTQEAKLSYLELCGPSGLRQVFKTEMDVSLLGQVVKMLADAVSVEVESVRLALIVHNTMIALPDTGRFKLNVQFMSALDRNNIGSLFTWLLDIAANKDFSARLPFTLETVDAARAKFLE